MNHCGVIELAQLALVSQRSGNMGGELCLLCRCCAGLPTHAVTQGRPDQVCRIHFVVMLNEPTGHAF